jgi:hypothetical protein
MRQYKHKKHTGQHSPVYQGIAQPGNYPESLAQGFINLLVNLFRGV